MPTPNRIPLLVVGGGIGGLSAALALARAGHRVSVFEQAEEFAEVGAGLQLAPNATRILRRLGVFDAVAENAVFPKRLQMMDALEGTEITALDLGEAFLSRYGAPYVVMHRHDLLSALLAACRQHEAIDLHPDRRVVSVRPNPGEARVGCSDGAEYACDAVVGADGIRSTCRRLLIEDEEQGTGYVAYRGTVSAPAPDGDARLETVRLWIGPGLHLVQYPLRGGELLNQVAVFRSARYSTEHEDWGTPEELRERFAATAPRIAAAVERLDQTMRWPMYDRLPIPEWTRGRVTLLGDAAHPMLQYLAQGACQAIEDADQLAASFRPGDDPEQAFRAYEKERIPRTARIQSTARAWGELWHLDGVARATRNRLLRQREPDDYSETDWLYEFDRLPARAAMTGKGPSR